MAVTPPQDHMTLEDDDYNIDETQSTPSSIDIGTTPSPFWLPNPTSNDHTQSPFVYMNTFNPMTSTNNGARNININPIQPYSASSSPTMDYQPSVFDNSLDIGSRIQNEYQYRPPPEQPPPPLHPMIYLPNGIDRKYPSLRSLFSSFSLENTGYGTRGPMILNSIIGDRRANFPDYPQTITSGAFDQFRPANIFRPNGFLNQIPGFGGYGSGIIGRIGGWLGDKKIIPLPTNDYHRIIGQPIALLNGRHSDMFIDDYQNGGGRSLQIPPPLYPNPYVGGMNFVGNNNRNGFVDYINNNNNYGINGYHP